MKSRKTSKTHKSIHPSKKAKGKTRARARTRPRSTTVPSTNPPVPTHVSNVKACEEVEIGDVGGFGDTEELEAHEKRCGQVATEFCHSCGRNLCTSHYELLHRDHDTTASHNTGQSLASQ